MGQSPQELRRDIAATRDDMDRTLDQISDRVSPRRIAQRRTRRVRSAWSTVRTNVMWSAGGGPGIGDRARDSGNQARERIEEAPHMIEERTRGNPLAAGMVAFGLGLLGASALPRTGAEHRAAAEARDRLEPAAKAAGEAVRETGEHLQQRGQEAAESLKGQAQEAVGTVKDDAQQRAASVGHEARDRGQSVKEDARSRAEQVRDERGDQGPGGAPGGPGRS